MTDRLLLTPFFLDQGSPGHLRLRTGSSWVNQPTFFDNQKVGRLHAIQAPLAQAVHSTLTNGQRPVSIAGDCCAVIPVVAGLQRSGISPRLLWLDAHGDFNTPQTSPSGFIGGMPLAMLCGRGDLGLMQHLGVAPLAERDVMLFDGRDLDPLERDALANSEVRQLKDVDELAELQLGDRPLHIHLDMDVIDPQDCPAVHYPVPGGPRLADLVAAVRRLVATARPASVSVTTWVMDEDPGGISQTAAMQLLNAALGTH